jgi:hypothetical protein
VIALPRGHAVSLRNDIKRFSNTLPQSKQKDTKNTSILGDATLPGLCCSYHPGDMAYQETQTKPQFLRKLGYLCVGLAIGFVLLGFIQKFKKAHASRVAQQHEAEEAAAKAAPPIFPPTPTEEASGQQATPTAKPTP